MENCPITADVLESLRSMDDSGQSSLLGELYGIFLNDANKQYDEICLAIAGADPKRLQMAAHSLKGSSGSLGAATVADLCKTLESMGKSGVIGSTEITLARLSDELDRVRNWTHECGFVMPPSAR
ncbi:MAG: Hpt domain-containing protein [Planctomycetes bacterium]|nr:Hpt domain-containing protein [Planctomycetota bacterium]